MSDRWVAVLAGGLSHERDVSLRSGRRLSAALRSVGMTVAEWDADSRLLSRIEQERPDAVVVALHGGEGENGAVQSVLDMYGIPYVGTDPRACRRAWDKPTAKAELARSGLTTPDWVVLPHATFRELGAQSVLDALVAKLGLPLMLKPDQGGSALGARVVRDAADLPSAMVGALSYGDTVLVEKYIEGTEVAIGVLDGPDGPEALPAVQIEATNGVYDYTARYTAGLTTYRTPAELSPETAAAAGDLAVAAHRLLGLRDVSRTDAIIDRDGTVHFLEVNVSPGLTETSLLPMAIEAAGRSLGDVFATLVERAISRS
ncbi:D-alanine-D-alanine ligase [Saccharopolyspora erythraea NRRL 2338]|uniref:D-alanine--D-alanine ligase n=2 Tax=Saccharopolyspora erythraea TaxID=1836 RepID=A4FR70_SACEN|nr:D-alanine--D-alanine ligase [Saccharopolyspora erythraea]EQD87953.1 D-alanine--D-alanine ligase [Saccharopolyspora erythraea D]PFG93146.1 D-alanine-D-alanine ligase [Saccharopolyspora erythraea NRRL 2338]QRK90012.1 D-alanine--D-alanine ligase [Saccharopolyspora erythraea]CAM06545.1 D-alanine--D-alanine ligase B [Saccharopolyspora erythraea NRRL 2338]